MFALGENHGVIVEKTWDEAVESSGVNMIPNIDMQKRLIGELSSLGIKFVASGHGPCMKITS